MFTGTYTAIVTPFKNGRVDEGALETLVKLQLKAGIDGIVPVGTTGESPTLSYDEHIDVIKLVVQFCKGTVKVLAGDVAETRTIRTGISNNVQVQVLEGLREGEKVVVGDSTSLPKTESSSMPPHSGGKR